MASPGESLGLQVPAWRDRDDLVHGFCGRAGGVSGDPYRGLNLSYRVGDTLAAVDENWQLLRDSLPAALRFLRLEQVHGNEVHVATGDRLELGAGDAVATATAGIVAGVLTADCVPVLLCSRDGRAVAAVHAGWRGTVLDIVGATVRCFATDFGVEPAAIEAAVGPAIGACCYEVGDEVRQQFAAVSPMLLASAARGRALDLRQANRHLLEQAGVPPTAIHLVGPCTRCAASDYFSHRAAGGAASGRQLSFIARRPSI